MRVAVLCEFSGIVRDAFIARGHDAVSCDLLPSEAPGPHVQGDCLAQDWSGYDLLICHPPCTHLSSSGARHFAAKRADGRQQAAIDFFMAMAALPVQRIVIENPIGVMSSVWREPDQIIQPWQFGHAETKATCLWLIGIPPLSTDDPLFRPSTAVEPDYMRRADGTYYTDKKGKRYSRIHYTSGRMKDKERWKERSRTYPGIAAAMAEQWGSLLVEATR